MIVRPSIAILTTIVALTATISAQQKPIPDSEFTRLHTELCPTKKAKWQKIPWMVDLLAARRRAIKVKKPLFMWSMNGHPLGCT